MIWFFLIVGIIILLLFGWFPALFFAGAVFMIWVWWYENISEPGEERRERRERWENTTDEERKQLEKEIGF